MVSLDLRPVIAMSRAVSTTAPLPEILATIARAAAQMLDADAAVVLIASPSGLLRFAADHGLTPHQRQPWIDGIVDKPDAMSDWEQSQSFQSMMTLPLCSGSCSLGALSVYRHTSAPWPAQARGLMELIAANAASAVRTAQLIDEQNHRISVHARLVRGLRAQTQAHMEKLSGLRDQLDGGSGDDVSRAVADLEVDLSEHYQKVNDRIESRIVAALLLGEASIARSRNVRFVLDSASRLASLPSGLSEFDVVTIVSNLLENSFDAVAAVDGNRRRVALLICQHGNRLRIRVRDWGAGLPPQDTRRLTSHGFSTKSGHTGIGLALVAHLAEAHGGTLRLERRNQGAVVEVAVPYGC